MNIDLFANVDRYIAELTAIESDALRHCRTSIKNNNWSDQSISPVQGKLLQVFAKICNAKRILELGTFGAYSTIWLANALPEDGKLITIEYDHRHAVIAKENIDNAKLNHKVEIIQGNAMEILKGMITENVPGFDLIFIDADKPPYLEYFKMAIELSRKGSMIICDNVIRNGKILDTNSDDEKVTGVKRLNEYLKICDQVTSTILQTVGEKEYDGMVLAVVN